MDGLAHRCFDQAGECFAIAEHALGGFAQLRLDAQGRKRRSLHEAALHLRFNSVAHSEYEGWTASSSVAGQGIPLVDKMAAQARPFAGPTRKGFRGGRRRRSSRL